MYRNRIPFFELFVKQLMTPVKYACARLRMLLLLSAAITVSGCMVGPDYRRPAVDVPQTWRFEEKETKNVADTAWWEQFQDPVLNELIRVGLTENKDVKIAAARVEQFLGQYVTTRASLFPQVSAGATAGQDRVTERGPFPITPGTENPADNFQLFAGASWELDFWGKLRRATEAARADMLSTEEARRGVILTLVSSIANSYINLRSLDKQLEISERTAASRRDSYELFKLRFQGGIISELELSQIRSQYEEALANIPAVQKSIAQQEDALSVLLGRNPGQIPRGKTIDELVPPAVPAGLPSGLLERRPDIRQAEEDLIAANARIGVAKSLYFPTISLTGVFGWASTDLSDLFTGPARTWSWAAPITAPIFTAGAISGQVKAAEAFKQETLVRYQQSIQNAFREVDDALIDRKRTMEQLDVQGKWIESLSNYARIARLRFDNGYTSYIEVLDAERSLFGVELQHAQTKGVLFQAMVNLYRAMGGGWVTVADRVVSGAAPSVHGAE
jgi:multidrug efflux system outer membrane protein